MVKFISGVAVVLAVLGGPVLHAQSVQSIFIPANMEWKSSTVTDGLRVAENAELFIFNHDHFFAHISGVLYKSNVSGKITICVGCGFSSEKGSWSIVRSSVVLVHYRLAHSDIRTDRKPEWKQEKWQMRGGKSPLNAQAIQASKIDLVSFHALANPEVVAALLRDDN